MFNCIKCNYKVRYFISIFFLIFLKINGGWHFTGDIIMDIYKKTDNFICSMVKVYQNACFLWCDSGIEVFMSSNRHFLYFVFIRSNVYMKFPAKAQFEFQQYSKTDTILCCFLSITICYRFSIGSDGEWWSKIGNGEWTTK